MQFVWEIYQTRGWKWKPCLLSPSIFIKACSFTSVASVTLSTRQAFIAYWHQLYELLWLRDAFAKGSSLGIEALLQCLVLGCGTSGTVTLWGPHPGDRFCPTSQTIVVVIQPGSVEITSNLSMRGLRLVEDNAFCFSETVLTCSSLTGNEFYCCQTQRIALLRHKQVRNNR